MSNFPALIPSQRTWTPGEYPNTAFAAWSNKENRVLHSNMMIDSTLRLTFIGLSEQEMLSIFAHYQAQQGSYGVFALPSEVFSGTSNTANYSLPNYRWRYAEPPAVEDLPCGSHIVELVLESSPLTAAISTGDRLSLQLLIQGGQAVGNAVDGINQTISISLAAGSADVFIPELYNALLFNGNQNNRSLTGLGFKPGFLWIQQRSGLSTQAASTIWDYASGVTRYWNTASQSVTNLSTGVTSFDADGFSLGTSAIVNFAGRPFIARGIAEGAAAATNTDGTITTTVRVNAQAGFSIITYTGTGNADTIGHGLSGAPDFVIFRRITGSANTGVVTPSLVSSGKWLILNTNFSEQSTTLVSAIGSTTISLGAAADFGNWSNASGQTYIAYAFKSASGTSKIDTYTGGGSTATTVTLGFEPEFVMIKSVTATGDWMIFDAPRGVDKQLLANTNANETTVDKIIFNSDGFTVKANENANTNAVTYLYMAFK